MAAAVTAGTKKGVTPCIATLLTAPPANPCLSLGEFKSLLPLLQLFLHAVSHASAGDLFLLPGSLMGRSTSRRQRQPASCHALLHLSAQALSAELPGAGPLASRLRLVQSMSGKIPHPSAAWGCILGPMDHLLIMNLDLF
eukprot:1161060-Pelagomonas_calceolata.AAC.5